MAVYGLDLSVHNGDLDFNAIKAAGHDFVILRAGFGSQASQKDKNFEKYYAAAKAAGLKVGAYHYSYALTAEQAVAEAKTFLDFIKGKTFEYPVFIDMEDADGYKRKHGMPSNDTLCKICENFCNYVQASGYYVGVYASESWFHNQLAGMSRAYDLWVANWGKNTGSLTADLSGSYHLHQYTSEYRFAGKRFDKNVCYVDYPSIIASAGLNGLSGATPTPAPATPTTPSGSSLELAAKVMQGAFGDGDARKQALGSKYDEVQAIINHVLTTDANTLANEVKAGVYGNGDIRKAVLGSRYTEVQNIVNGASTPKMRKGAKVQYSGHVYADSTGGGRGAKVSGTYTVTILNNNSHGAHLGSVGWVKPSDCKVIG